jgi:hypothetical protein
MKQDGGLMERMELEQLVQSLQKRSERLERRQGHFLAVTLVLLMVFLVAGWQIAEAPRESLKARSLSIVDSSGIARLTLAAPVPNPVVEGKVRERISPGTGITFNDAAGNERGGIGMFEDGSMDFCFDDAKTERDCFFFTPKLGNGLNFNDANGKNRAVLYLDKNGAPHLILKDDQGQPLVSLPDPSKSPGGK